MRYTVVSLVNLCLYSIVLCLPGLVRLRCTAYLRPAQAGAPNFSVLANFFGVLCVVAVVIVDTCWSLRSYEAV